MAHLISDIVHGMYRVSHADGCGPHDYHTSVSVAGALHAQHAQVQLSRKTEAPAASSAWEMISSTERPDRKARKASTVIAMMHIDHFALNHFGHQRNNVDLTKF